MIGNRRPPPRLFERRDLPGILVGTGMGVIGLAFGIVAAKTWPDWAAQAPNWQLIVVGLLVGGPIFVAGGLLHARAGEDDNDG